jgi:MFS family permease
METDSKKIGLIPFFLGLTCSVVAMSFQVAQQPHFTIIQNNLGLSVALMMLLASSVGISNAFVMLPFGKLLDKINPIRFALLCFVFLISLSFLSIFIKEYTPMLIVRLFAGLAMAPLYTIGSQIPQIVYPREQRNKLASIQSLAGPIGTIIAIQGSTFFGGFYGYTYSYIPTLGLCLIGVVLVAICWNIGFERTSDLVNLKPTKITYLMAFVWLIFSGVVAGAVLNSISKIGNDFGLTTPQAAIAPVLFMLPAFAITSIVSMTIDKKIKRSTTLIISGLCVSVIIILLTINIQLWYISAILLGIFASMIPPIVMSSPSKYERPENTAFSISIINFSGTIGFLTLPFLFGAIKDITTSWTIAIIVMSVFMASIPVLIFTFRRRL